MKSKHEKNDQQKNAKLDQRWYSALRAISINELSFITPGETTYSEAKTDFLNGTVRNPVLVYPELHKFDAEAKTKELQDFEKMIVTEENNSLVKEAYSRVIAEQLVKVSLINACIKKDDYGFMNNSNALYGLPKRSIYIQIARWFNWHRVHSRNVLNKLAGLYSSSDVSAAFFKDMVRLGLDGWKTEIDTSGKRGNISVDHGERLVYIPADERLNMRNTPLTQRRVRGLRRHEIGVHITRRVQGLKSPLKLLGFGLDGYMLSEEGIAVREELRAGTGDKLAWNGRYLAASLCYGLDGPFRDFRDVYEELYKYISAMRKGQDGIVKNEDVTYQICVRIFRGTTGSSPACFYSKDIVYAGGLARIMGVIAEYPKEQARFLKGKYDPGNPAHRDLMDALGIV
jgi:hypothetical protein